MGNDLHKKLVAVATVVLVAGLSGCGTTTTAIEPPVVVPIAEELPVSAVSSGQRVLEAMLAKAEKALAEDRLMTPEYDNAYDRFRAVLLLQPYNQQAQTGIQQILARYVQLGSDALAVGNTRSAQKLLASAEQLDAGSPLVLELKQRLREAQYIPRVEKPKVVSLAHDEEIVLPAKALAARSDSVAELLAAVAERMAASDETVLIYARNDAEGRWVYQQMRRAVPDYRLRGDIKISGRAKLILLPPIY